MKQKQHISEIQNTRHKLYKRWTIINEEHEFSSISAALIHKSHESPDIPSNASVHPLTSMLVIIRQHYIALLDINIILFVIRCSCQDNIRAHGWRFSIVHDQVQ